jgi:phospholipase C
MQNRVPQRAAARWRLRLLSSVAIYGMAINTMAPLVAVAADTGANDGNTTTPIKHVITIIGENRTFDHIFATYQPVNKNEAVWNLLSEGIINSDGTPGPNYQAAVQKHAQNRFFYSITAFNKAPYQVLPTPLAGGPTANSDTAAPFNTIAQAMQYENGLPSDYYVYLTTGATGLTYGVPDTRIYYDGHPVTNLPPGPFQLTDTNNPNGQSLSYDDYANSPVHRFYQMWQQLDCVPYSRGASLYNNCGDDLVPWVEVTIGAGNNGKPQPPNFNDATTGEGATAMAFYNVQQGDAPYLKHLADTYSMSDNYHQAVNGGTGANHIMLGTGDAIWFSDGNGNPTRPPQNQLIAAGTANAGIVDEVENPNPQPGTNNYYTEDGYGGGSYGSPSYGGGSYAACAYTLMTPGASAVVSYLQSLPRPVSPNCDNGHYYLLNNYNPGYYGDGTNAYTDSTQPTSTPQNDQYRTVFTVPPSSVKNIGDELLANNVTFAYFGDQFNYYLANPYLNYVDPHDQYCNICNFFQYSTSIMTNTAARQMALKDTIDLYNDIANNTLPAVSFVKPSGYLDGHPASSKIDLLEGFIKKIVDMVQANPALAANTAIFITMDEGGGYYDSGYVQPLDFFGDGTRIPMIVVSQYSTGGHISHTYTDHVSILKFIEANWSLPPLTNRSRDNLPNPKVAASPFTRRALNPYVPVNSPAIGDLMDLFQFPAK